MRSLLKRKIQWAFSGALLFLLLAGTGAWWSARQNREAFHLVEQTRDLLDHLDGTQIGRAHV